MSNQKKNIEELGYARHGYATDGTPPTLREVAAGINGISTWTKSISQLFTMPVAEFIAMQCGHWLVPDYVDDFPADLKQTDSYAYLSVSRNEAAGLMQLVGAQSGYQFSRRLNVSNITAWTAVQGDTVHFATFDIDPATGELAMYTNPGYSGPEFSIEDDNLVITI